MLIKTDGVYDQAADAERLISKRSPAAQKAIRATQELRNEAVAKRRWQKGVASSPIVPGKWTEKVIIQRDGTKVVLKRPPGERTTATYFRPDGTVETE